MSAIPDPSMIGVAPPPPGVTPNFVNPVTNNAAPIAATCITLPIAVGFVVMRLVTKSLIINKLSMDDAFIVLGLVLSLMFTGVIEWSVVHFGAGRHLWDMPLEKFSGYLKMQYVSALLYIMALLFVKLSILSFYLRIFHVEKGFRLACKLVIGFVVCLHLSGFLATTFICNPVKKSWNPMLPGHCGDIVKVASVTGGITVFSDFLILFLPLPMILRLQMKTKQKIALLGVFATGTFVCASSMTREIVTVRSQSDPDFSWIQNRTLVWYIAETNVAIICACMPVLKPFLNHIVGEKLHLSSFIHSRRSSRYPSWVSSKLSNSKSTTTDRSRTGHVDDDKYVELGPVVDGAGVPGSLERSGLKTTVDGGAAVSPIPHGGYNSRISTEQRNHIVKSNRVDMDVDYLDGRPSAY